MSLIGNFWLSNCVSNICPQKPKLNRQLWRNLEMKVADEYSEEREEVWIFCGPIFHGDIEELSSGVEVPDTFYKIVIDEQDNTVRLLAFIMQQGVSGNEPLESFLSSVDQIEDLTGIDFLPALSDELENEIESETANRVW